MLQIENNSYREKMDKDELAYLTKNATKQKKAFMKAVHYIFLCLALFMTALYTYANFTYDAKNIDPDITTPLTPAVVLQIAVGMFSVFAFVLFVVYTLSIATLFKEIKNGLKTIEQAIIIEKKYMPQTQTYHFFLNSIIKKSIEVSKKDFDFFDVNDEINIEYSPKSFQLFGYH